MYSHSKEDEIKKVADLPKKERNDALASIRRRGIKEHNERQFDSDSAYDKSYQCERRHDSRTNNILLNHCSTCNKFLTNSHFQTHKCNTNTAYKSREAITGLIGPMAKKFQKLILPSMRNDVVGNFIKENLILLKLGLEEFKVLASSEKEDTSVSRTQQYLRKIGRLCHAAMNIAEEQGELLNIVDLFRSRNLIYFETALHDEEAPIMSKKNLGYALKKAACSLRTIYLMEERDDVVNRIDKFIKLFEGRWQTNFRQSEKSCIRRRMTHTRKPANLPEESSISKTVAHLDKVIEKLNKKVLKAEDFVEVRRTVLTRIIILNARRPNEPSSLTLEDMKDGLNDVWLTKMKNPKNLNKYFITYVKAKNSIKDVDVLIPRTYKKLIEFLMSTKIRDEKKIPRSNNYVFASRASKKHTCGNHELLDVCKALKIKPFTAGQVRHYISSKFANTQCDDDEENLFYDHMGHSKSISKKIYQVPKANATLDFVGSFLDKTNNLLIGKSSQQGYVLIEKHYFYVHSSLLHFLIINNQMIQFILFSTEPRLLQQM